MDRTVDLNTSREIQRALLTVEEVRRIIAQARDATEIQHPINIQINLGDGDSCGRRRDEGGSRFFRSKLVWIVVAMSLAMGVAYARTRYVCQSFKDEGRFFYGMGIDRCVGVLIKQPFETIEVQLQIINRSY